jgi:hypothetical protein
MSATTESKTTPARSQLAEVKSPKALTDDIVIWILSISRLTAIIMLGIEIGLRIGGAQS